jgi:WD40 repeat protein
MKLPSTALSLASHAQAPLLAVGLVRGGAAVGARDSFAVVALPGATRAVAFAPGAPGAVYAASDAGHLSRVDAAAQKAVFSHAVAAPADDGPSISALAALDANVVAAGDDNGGLRLFDVRVDAKAAVASVLEQGDYVSAIHRIGGGGDGDGAAAAPGRLAVASGDGSLCVYDMRLPPHAKLKLVAATPGFDDDLLSLAMVSGGTRAVGGTLSGAVNVYNMQLVDADEDEPDMGRFVERFFGHPDSVSAVVVYGEQDIVLTGSSDGLVRVIDPVRKAVAGVLPYLDRGAGEGASESECDGGVDEGEDVESSDGDGDDDDDDDDDGGGRGGRDDGGAKDKAGTTGKGARVARSKFVSWPVEGMAVVRGLPKPLIAVIGHRASVRFCDASLLDDGDGDEEGDEDEAVESGARPAKRRKGKASAERQTSFFADL